jgi:hypothetical protein
MDEESLTQIACLACGAVRATFGTTVEETGDCPRCHYLGWTYADDLDGTTKRMIMNGRLAHRPSEAAHSLLHGRTILRR